VIKGDGDGAQRNPRIRWQHLSAIPSDPEIALRFIPGSFYILRIPTCVKMKFDYLFKIN